MIGLASIFLLWAWNHPQIMPVSISNSGAEPMVVAYCMFVGDPDKPGEDLDTKLIYFRPQVCWPKKQPCACKCVESHYEAIRPIPYH